ncbi:MAG: gliding motility-associated C-terminal domain-containing protein [Flavobacteriales bacterium]
MFKNYFSFFLLLFLPFLGYAQNVFSVDAIEICESYEYKQVSVKPVGFDNVDFQINNFDTVPVTQDDRFSRLINFGFTFNFFGVNYTQGTISSNGYLSFDATLASPPAPAPLSFSQWSINADIPNAGNTHCYTSVMAPFTDSEPGPGSAIISGTAGVAPNRVFMVIWKDLEMFGGACDDLCLASSLVLFEGSNEIMTSIANYENCVPGGVGHGSGWNDGAGVHGLGKDATTAVIVVDPITGAPRNHSDPWNTTNETTLFTPSGTGTSMTYTYQFNPVYSNFAEPIWYDTLGNEFARGFEINYQAPHLDDLPTYVSVSIEVCGDTISADLPVLLGCPGFETSVTGESCEGMDDGRIDVYIEEECGPSNEVWSMNLLDVNGNVVESIINSNVPITFNNLERGYYSIAYSSPSRPRCVDTLEALVPYEYFKPQVHADITDPLCFEEESGIISFQPHGGYNKEWSVEVYNNAGNNVGSYFSNEIPINLEGLGAGTYDVVVVSPTTCKDTISYTLVDPNPLYFFKEEFDHNKCGAFTGMFDFVPANGNPPYTYYVNGKQTINLTKQQQVTSGSYELKVIDDNGCEIVRDIEILDLYSPIVDFDMPLEVNLADGAVTFTDLTEPNPHTTLTNWHWEFGDSEVSFEQNPKHTYSDIGEYKVHLFVTDATGCQEFAVKTIRVVKPEFLLPTVFTPNGDGNNEVFIPVLDKIVPDDFKITISDRWGRIVYTSTNIFEGWDGRDTKGNIAEGSYIWIAEFKDKFGHDHVSDGFVQLIR